MKKKNVTLNIQRLGLFVLLASTVMSILPMLRGPGFQGGGYIGMPSLENAELTLKKARALSKNRMQDIDEESIEEATSEDLMMDLFWLVQIKDANGLGERLEGLNRDYYGHIQKAYFLRFGKNLKDEIHTRFKDDLRGKLGKINLEALDDWGGGISLSELQTHKRLPLIGPNGELSLDNLHINSLRGEAFPAGLQQLYLHNNQLTTLAGATFPAGLEYLQLSDNQITTLTGAAFPVGLRQLYLYNNQLTTLAGATFPAGLEYLQLSDNKLTTLAGAVFPAGLQQLHLYNNQLITLAGAAFPAGLQQLYLNNNQIRTISDETIALLVSLQQLETLDLSGNPLDLDNTKARLRAAFGDQVLFD